VTKDNHLAGETYVVLVKIHSCGDTFFDDACLDYYQCRLRYNLTVYHVSLHAYCLLKSAALLLLTPATPLGTGRLLEAVNARYSEYYEQRFRRRLTPQSWTSRSTRLRGHGQVLEYQRLVESVPLISGLVRHPGSHHWTSYCSNALSSAGWLTPHRGAMGLLRRAAGGRTQYRKFFESGFDAVRASALLRNLGAEGSILSARSYR